MQIFNRFFTIKTFSGPFSTEIPLYLQLKMNKRALYLLLVFALASLTPHGIKEEILRLPKLLEHFQEHREINSDTDIWEFIALHYGSEYQDHESEHDHSELPGKQEHLPVCAFSLNVPALPNYIAFFQIKLPEEHATQKVFFPPTCFSHDPLSRIWQPPKRS